MPARRARRIGARSALRRRAARRSSPSRLAVDRLVDQPPHARDVVAVGRAVGDRDAGLARGVVDALLDDRPERVRRLAVADRPRSAPTRRAGRRRARAPPRASAARAPPARPGPRGRPRARSSCRRSRRAADETSARSEQAPHHVVPRRSGIRADSRVPSPSGLSSVELALERREPVAEAAQARAGVDLRAADAVVGDHDLDRRRRGGARSPWPWSALAYLMTLVSPSATTK